MGGLYADRGGGGADGKWRDGVTLLSAYRPSPLSLSLPLSPSFWCSHFEFLSSSLSTRSQLLTWWKLQHAVPSHSRLSLNHFLPPVFSLEGTQLELKSDSIPGNLSSGARKKRRQSSVSYIPLLLSMYGETWRH